MSDDYKNSPNCDDDKDCTIKECPKKHSTFSIDLNEIPIDPLVKC